MESAASRPLQDKPNKFGGSIRAGFFKNKRREKALQANQRDGYDTTNNNNNNEKDEDSLEKSTTTGTGISKTTTGMTTASTGPQHWTFTRFMAVFGLGMLLAGSQIPVYLIGGGIHYVYNDIGGSTTYAWIALANLLALAATAPMAGAISDLIGRRYVSLLAALLICVGMVVVGTAHEMNVAIGGMAIAGVGAGLGELVAAAGVSEIVPVKQRGTAIALLFLFILPFCPAAAYAQLLGYYHTWRWTAWMSLIYNAIAGLICLIWYHPPPRVNSDGLTKMQILKRIDYLGSALSISGFVLFLVGIAGGGYTHPWKSAYTIATTVVGAILIILFIIWQNFAPYPMIPGYIFKNERLPRIVGFRISILTLIITAISGAYFYSLLFFFPLTLENVYNPDPHFVAKWTSPFGFSIAIGVIVISGLLSGLNGYNRELVLISSIMMTVGVGCLSLLNYDNYQLIVWLGFLGGLGCGGIVVPASIILSVVSPDEVIATVIAVTLSVRLVGGAIGFAVFYNVFISKFTSYYTAHVVERLLEAGAPAASATIWALYTASDAKVIPTLPGITPELIEVLRRANGEGWAHAFRYLYLSTVPFGGIACICCFFLGNINKYMVDRVAVNL